MATKDSSFEWWKKIEVQPLEKPIEKLDGKSTDWLFWTGFAILPLLIACTFWIWSAPLDEYGPSTHWKTTDYSQEGNIQVTAWDVTRNYTVYSIETPSEISNGFNAFFTSEEGLEIDDFLIEIQAGNISARVHPQNYLAESGYYLWTDDESGDWVHPFVDGYSSNADGVRIGLKEIDHPLPLILFGFDEGHFTVATIEEVQSLDLRYQSDYESGSFVGLLLVLMWLGLPLGVIIRADSSQRKSFFKGIWTLILSFFTLGGYGLLAIFS